MVSSGSAALKLLRSAAARSIDWTAYVECGNSAPVRRVRRIGLEWVQRPPSAVVPKRSQIRRRHARGVDQQHLHGNWLVRRAWRDNAFADHDLVVFGPHADRARSPRRAADRRNWKY